MDKNPKKACGNDHQNVIDHIGDIFNMIKIGPAAAPEVDGKECPTHKKK